MSRRKEIIKIRSEINRNNYRTTVEKNNQTKSWFFEKITLTDKPSARLTKEKRGRTEINKIRNEKGDTTTDTKEIGMTIRGCCEKLYVNKLDSLEEMEKFLETYNSPRLRKK